MLLERRKLLKQGIGLPSDLGKMEIRKENKRKIDGIG